MHNIKTLTTEDVIAIHERLTDDALQSDDPISPAGIKNPNLLESAVSRQHAGFGGSFKYGTPYLNAATLCYGICCNHPLHNGNKRTALVAMLCHLDANNLTFNDRANQGLLFSFMKNVAGHTLPLTKRTKQKDQSDAEVTYMADWLSKKTRKVEKGERMISYRDFEALLKEFNVYFENYKNNYVDVVKYKSERRKKGFFGHEIIQVKEKVANIPYWPNRMVGKNLVKSVRSQASLTYKDGVDSALFYGDALSPDDFIVKYKKTLKRLAKT